MGLSAYQRLQDEEQLTLKAAARLFPQPVSVRTLQRYVARGVKGHLSGERIRLESFRSDGKARITSTQAVRRFLAKLNEERE